MNELISRIESMLYDSIESGGASKAYDIMTELTDKVEALQRENEGLWAELFNAQTMGAKELAEIQAKAVEDAIESMDDDCDDIARTIEELYTYAATLRQGSSESVAYDPNDIKPHEISISTYSTKRKSAWVLSADNGVCITHIPTGLKAECAGERSQHRNKTLAMEKLKQLVAHRGSSESDGGVE